MKKIEVTKNVKRYIIEAFTLATLITSILVILELTIFKSEINYWETAAVFFSFACTWLVTRQTRFNYVLGVISTILLSYVFWTQNLYGSMVLNLYLIPTVIYGWFIWGKDTNTKPVQHVKIKVIPIYLIVTIITWAGAYYLINYFGGEMGVLDGWLLIGSTLAQFLLDRKKIETWIIWILVNIVSVYVYFESGLYLLAGQFLLFLVNAIIAYSLWNKDLKKNKTEILENKFEKGALA